MLSSLLRLGSLDAGRAVPFLAILLEVLWAYLWVTWISTWQAVGWAGPPVDLVGAVVLAAVAELLSRFVLGGSWSLWRVRLAVLTTLALLLALVLRLEQGGGYGLLNPGWGQYALGHLSPLSGGLAFGAYLLWRGISVGRESLSFDDLYRKFLFGLTALVVLLVLWGATSKSDVFQHVLSTAGLYAVAYFTVGLLALAIVNLQSIQQQLRRHQESLGLFQRRWLSLVVGIVLAVVVVSVAIASVFSFDLVALLLRPLNILANWLLIAFLYGVVLPLGFVVTGLVYVLRFLLHFIRPGQPPEPFNPPDLSDLQRLAEGQQPQGFPPEALLALKWGLVALLVLLVVFILARALFRYWRGKPEEGIEEVSESLWSWQAFMGDLHLFLSGLLRRFRRPKAAVPLAVSPPKAVAQEEDQASMFTVREIYQGLLWEGRRAGSPRSHSETPYEYQGKLKGHAESGVQELQAITEAYVAERYGGLTIGGEPLQQLNRLWRSLRSALRNKNGGGEMRAS